MGNRFHWTLKHNKLTRKENVAQAWFKCNILNEISESGIFFFQVLFENNRRLKSLSHNFLKFIFYWRIIALQNFAIFCQMSTWISHRYTYIPFLLNLPPISIQQIPVGYLFYILWCKFPCYSFHTSHPPPLSPCP